MPCPGSKGKKKACTSFLCSQSKEIMALLNSILVNPYGFLVLVPHFDKKLDKQTRAHLEESDDEGL